MAKGNGLGSGEEHERRGVAKGNDRSETKG